SAAGSRAITASRPRRDPTKAMARKPVDHAAGAREHAPMSPSPQPKHYRVIYADPPWTFATYSRKGKGRSPEAYYDCMPLADIKALPVAEWAADDCVLLLWTTDPLLEKAFEIVRAWGFTYKTVGFYWAKLKKLDTSFSEDSFFTGLGFRTRPTNASRRYARGPTSRCSPAYRGPAGTAGARTRNCPGSGGAAGAQTAIPTRPRLPNSAAYPRPQGWVGEGLYERLSALLQS